MMQRVLLGPQRRIRTVGTAFELLGVRGRIAVISAGWQEREAEDGELSRFLGNRTTNLALHARADAAFREDQTLFTAHRTKQDRLHRLQDLYRLQLEAALTAAKRLQRIDAPADLIEPELEATMRTIRALDKRHVARMEGIEHEYEAAVGLARRPSIQHHVEEISSILSECDAVAIAGGHVASLINRIRLFGLTSLLAAKPLVGWSAGAMVLTDRIVLFHDNPPQGAGNAEILSRGLGLAPGVVALPHASSRLNLDDPQRVSLLARRFAPALCLALDDGCAATLAKGWTANGPTCRLTTDGAVVPVEGA
ncbi:MAG: hypothetical protein AMXMBFR64_19910 [Myxococcales bacterium]